MSLGAGRFCVCSGGGGKGGDDGGCNCDCVVVVPFVGFTPEAEVAGGFVRDAFDWYSESLIFGGGIALPVGGRFLNGLCSVLRSKRGKNGHFIESVSVNSKQNGSGFQK